MIVVEDTTVPGGAVVGAATLVREKKFIHSCGNVGRIEVIRSCTKYWWDMKRYENYIRKLSKCKAEANFKCSCPLQ